MSPRRRGTATTFAWGRCGSMNRSRTSVAIALVLVAAILAVGAAARPDRTTPPGTAARPESLSAGAAAAPPVPRVDTEHPPVTWGGPDGRRALDGPWIERGDRRDAGLSRGWSRGTFAGREVPIPFSPNAA